MAMMVSVLPGAALADSDPREGLGGGLYDAETASDGMTHVGNFQKDRGGLVNFTNSDLAFFGDHAIQGNYGGFQIMDISDPTDPKVRTEVVCPGGQGDPSVYSSQHGDLLFISVEQTNGRFDCGTQGNQFWVDVMRGIRIFDISNLDAPEQVGTVSLCRGSHTHTVVDDLDDPDTIYLYNSGTAGVANSGQLTDCNSQPADGENPSRWMTEIIEVPLDSPGDAAVVNQARLFQDSETGALDGLQNGPTQPQHPSGGPYSPSPNTNTCHDITVFPERGLAAGACQGNGLLIDISDPANPQRMDAVADVNFSYWHSANFNNDGTTVMFTDEWGGGGQPRCTPADAPEWGANAFYDIVETADGPGLEFAGYYKIPNVQTTEENCVAHQANLVPVPGRDLMVQAWYQGGVTVFDFTDPSDPKEIGFFDRGPINEEQRVSGGYWAAYWHEGNIYGSEMARGFDVFELDVTDELSENELAAASMVDYGFHNPMAQPLLTWEPSFTVARAHRDQAERNGQLSGTVLNRLDTFLDRAERFQDGPQARAAVANLDVIGRQMADRDLDALADAIADLADSLR